MSVNMSSKWRGIVKEFKVDLSVPEGCREGISGLLMCLLTHLKKLFLLMAINSDNEIKVREQLLFPKAIQKVQCES